MINLESTRRTFRVTVDSTSIRGLRLIFLDCRRLSKESLEAPRWREQRGGLARDISRGLPDYVLFDGQRGRRFAPRFALDYYG